MKKLTLMTTLLLVLTAMLAGSAGAATDSAMTEWDRRSLNGELELPEWYPDAARQQSSSECGDVPFTHRQRRGADCASGLLYFRHYQSGYPYGWSTGVYPGYRSHYPARGYRRGPVNHYYGDRYYSPRDHFRSRGHSPRFRRHHPRFRGHPGHRGNFHRRGKLHHRGHWRGKRHFRPGFRIHGGEGWSLRLDGDGDFSFRGRFDLGDTDVGFRYRDGRGGRLRFDF